jgi:HAMP domain-containing protein
MNWNSIRTKVLAALAACLITGIGGMLWLLNYSFSQNSQALAAESVESAQRLFTILSARETSKMTAVSETLLENPQVREAVAARNRDRLLELTAPLYVKLKAQGITNWMFHTPEPDMRVLLRLHNPAKAGDQLNRFMDREVVRTHALVTGNELAKAGFAVRILRPVADAQGQVAGYVELGEEIGRFISEMKTQTGDDYGLLLNKKFVDRQFWADSSATWKRRDNYDDHAGFVVADKTTPNDKIIQFAGSLGSVAGRGQVLERYRDGDSVFVRGIFPIYDAAHNAVGAMFVVRNITGVYLAFRNTQILLIAAIVGALLLGSVLVLTLLNRLVFRRLESIIAVATRVVGGDYDTQIQVSSEDEIGQFEALFEQFRHVFVDLMKNVPELQEKR